MTTPPPLTDRTSLLRHRARALRDPALFLHEAARDEVQDRLAMVTKTFTDPAVVTGFPQIWKDLWPSARVVEDAEVLDLGEASHDLVVHCLCLHWANDPVGQLIQCRRALRPDGLCLTLAFGGRTLNELRGALGQAEIDIAGGLSPRIAPMGEIRDLGGLLQRAGFALPVADSMPLTASYPSALDLMRDLRAMGESNSLTARLRRPTRRSVLSRANELYAEAHGDATGRVPATFEIIVLTGWAPDDNQPRPLRPGSAATRLADALGTNETALKD